MLPSVVLRRRPTLLHQAGTAAAAALSIPAPAAAATAARALGTTAATTTRQQRRRGGEQPNEVVVAARSLNLPRPLLAGRGLSTAASNPIKAKITGSLLEARDKGVPVEVGMEVELEHTFGPEHVQTFAALSGDDNPIHLDHAYATKQGIFKGAIVHGLLVGSLFGTIFGVTFPGCVYLQQSFKFSRPVYVGRPVTAVVEVTRRREREGSSPPSSILFCSTYIIDEDDVTAIAGEAVVMLVHKDKEGQVEGK